MSWAKRFAEEKKRTAEELERAEREAIASGKERFDLAKLELLLNRGPQAKRETAYRESYYFDAELRTLEEFAARLLAGEPWHNTWWGVDSDTARPQEENHHDDLRLALQDESYRERLAWSSTPVSNFLRRAGAFAEAVHADDDYIEKGMVMTARGGEIRRAMPADPTLPFQQLAPLLEMGRFARTLVARHPSTPEATLLELLNDPDREVSAAVRVRPANPPAVLERIREQDAARPADASRALPSIRARFHLPYNRRYGFGGEFPLKLLFIDDFTGRPDPRPLEDRIEVSVTTATFEKRMRELDPADAASRARWDELRSVIAAVEAAHPAALMELWNASKEDLRCDFEDASELSKSGLARLIDAGIYNWPCCAARPPYSALVFGYPLQGEVMLGRWVFDVAERVCTNLVDVGDVVTMARDIERTGWTLNPYGSDKRADRFAAWSLLRYLFMLHCHYRARREGLEERMQMWLDMHATHRQAADPTRPLLDATATLEAGDIIHLEATPQPPPGVAARKVEARAKLPYVAEGP